MPIRAQSADGKIHEFPDGTSPSVIDRVMFDYAKSIPAARPAPTPTPTLTPAAVKPGAEAPNALEKMGSLGSLAASAADVPLSAIAGLAGSSKTFTDLFGADNVASKALDDVSRLASEWKSSGARQDAKDAARVQKEAEGKGIWEEVKAAAKAFTYSPLETTASVLGSSVPYAATALGAAALAPASGGASLAALYGTVGAAASGAASGAGMIKGDIYDALYSAAREKGVPEERARAAAEKAQEYVGPNTDQIALGSLLGAAAAATGLSRQALSVVVRNAERKLLKTVTERTGRKSIVRGVAQGALEEAIPEATQAGQERYAQNVALKRAGYDVDPLAGVAGQAAFEGLASLIPGGFGGGKAAATENLSGVPLPQSKEQIKAERELARQAKAAGIDLDEESIGATYNALVTKLVAEGMPESEALIKASSLLPSIIGVPASDLGEVPTAGAAKPAPTVRVADVTPSPSKAEPTRAPLQEVTPDKLAETLPTIDAAFTENAEDFAAEYDGVTELTPEVRNAAAELVVSSGIDPIDAIGSVLESAQRAAAKPITAPVTPSVDEAAVAPVADAIKQAAAPTDTATPSLAETAARDTGITEAPVETLEEAIADVTPAPVEEAAPVVEEATPAPVEQAVAEPTPVAPEAAPEAPPQKTIIVVHGGSNFEGIDPKYFGTGEPGNIRPLGNGLYGYVIDSTNTDEIAKAVEFARRYAEKYGRGNKAVHAFQLDVEGARTGFNGQVIESLQGAVGPELQRYYETADARDALPVGSPERKAAQAEFEKAYEALKKIPEAMRFERLPVGLTEVGVTDTGRLKRIGKIGIEQSDAELVKIIQDALGVSETQQEAVAEEELAAEEAVVEEAAAEPEVDPYDTALYAIEEAFWATDEDGNPQPEIDKKAYDLLILNVENKLNTPEKILAGLQKAKASFGEQLFNQRYRPGTKTTGIPLADAQAAVSGVAKGIGATPNVVQSFDDLPPEAQQQARADGATDAAGIVTADGQVHLIADKLADAADAVATLYHEVLGHLGLAKLFRSRLDTRLKEMYRGNKKLRDDVDAFIAENPDAYPNDPDPLARAVEEILAQRSEGGKIEASLLAKIAGVIKDIGRRIGIKSDFSDAEIGSILSRAHDMAINGTQEGKTGQRYARKKKTGPGKEVQRAEQMLARSRNPGNLNQATSTIMKVKRSGRRLQNLMNIIPGVITTKRGRFMLQFLTPADVGRLAKRQSNALGMRLDKVALAMSEMRKARTTMQATLQQQTYRWNKFNVRFKAGGRILSDLINLGTLYNIDWRRADNVRDFIAQDDKIREIIADPKLGQRAKDNRIKARTELAEMVYARRDALMRPENGKGEGLKIFDMAAKAYRGTFDRQLAGVLARINNSSLSPTRKAAATKQVKAMFAEAEKIGLYFPLGREGDYWMRVGQGKNREYQQFVSQIDRDLALRERYDEMVENGEKRPYDEIIRSGELRFGDNANTLQDDVVENDPTRMLQGMLNELDAGNITDLKAVKEQLTQMYLQTMPKAAQAAAMQRREGISGFTANTLRTFATTQSAAANRLARLEHGDTIRNNLAAAYALIQNDPEQDQLKPYVDQFAEFAGRQLAPAQGDPWMESIANFANRATFLYMMTSLKTAIIQPLQLSTTGMSALVREYGANAPALAFRNMTRFYKLLGTSKLDEDGNVITKWGQPSMNDGGYINDEPDPEMQGFLKFLWNGGNDRGAFATNFTGDISGDRQGDFGVYDNVVLEATRKTLGFVHNFMTGAGFHTERISREVMFMSAGVLEYKKLRKAGVSPADAAKRAEQKAADLTLETLFDYNVDAKPMVARGPVGRVVFQFATFTMNMSSMLIRNFYNAVSLKSSLRERRDASILFFGTMATTFMWAGATGLPLYTMFMGLADVARELFRPLLEDDDEDPRMYDAESGNPLAYASMDLWFRQWFLPNMLGGGESQRAVEMGPISAATDINFSAPLSLNDMFFRDEQPADNVADAVENLLMRTGMGAAGGAVKQVTQGIDFMLAGDGQRAAEKLMPYNFLRQPLIARRLQEEGYITPKGVELKPAEFYTAGKVIAQGAGFGSTEVAEAQKRNILFSRATDKVDTVRGKVMRAYGDAYLKYLTKPTAENRTTLEKADEQYNEYNMEYGLINPITVEQMQQSVQSRAEDREAARQLGGIQTDKKNRVLAQDMLQQGQ